MSRTKSNNSKQTNSNYQSLYLWVSVFLDLITFQLTENSIGSRLLVLNILSILSRGVAAQSAGLQMIIPEFQVNTISIGNQEYPAITTLNSDG